MTCLVAINQKILNGSSNAYYLHISPRREYINHENCLPFFPWLSYVLKKALEFDLWYGFKHIYPPHRIFFATQKTKTNQTHNVKDLMVVEFFQIMFTKSSQLFEYFHYIEGIWYYYKISKISTTFLCKRFVLFSFSCIFEKVNFMLTLHFGGENSNHQYFS